MSTEAAREMTPEELFDMAKAARSEQRKPVSYEDVPMLSLMADERAHRRADAKLDRLIGMVEASALSAAEFRRRCTIQADGGRDRWFRWDNILAGFSGAFTVLIIQWLMG